MNFVYNDCTLWWRGQWEIFQAGKKKTMLDSTMPKQSQLKGYTKVYLVSYILLIPIYTCIDGISLHFIYCRNSIVILGGGGAVEFFAFVSFFNPLFQSSSVLYKMFTKPKKALIADGIDLDQILVKWND